MLQVYYYCLIFLEPFKYNRPKQKNKEATNTDLTNLTMNKSYMEIINNNKTKNQKSLKDIINHHFK